MSATNVTAFDERVYRELANRATKYYREMNLSSRLPVAITSTLDAMEYKKPIFDFTTGFQGGKEYSINPDMAITPKNTKTYDLGTVQVGVYYGPDELMYEGDYIVQSKQEKMYELARQVDLSLWKGIYVKGFDADGVGQGAQLENGILDQATTVIDLDGTDSALAAQGDVYQALVSMLTTIPFRYRKGREITLGMTSNFFLKANGAPFVFDDGVTEWDAFYKRYIAQGLPGFKVNPEVIISDDIFLDSTDTAGTNDRLFVMVAEPDIVERVYSRGISLMGEIPTINGGIKQGWGSRLRGCVHDADAVLYSEQITW